MAEKNKSTQKINSEIVAEQEKKNAKHPVLYIFSVILLIVIAVTFVGAPVVDDAVRGASSSISFGKFGDENIEYSQTGFFAQQREILANQMKSDSSDKQNWKWELYRVWRGAFERTVVHVGILSELRTNRTNISSDKINKLIIEYGPYKVDGEFDVEAYQATPSFRREEVRRDFKENLLKEYYLSDYVYGNKTPESEKDFTYGIMRDQRSFQLAFFPFDKISDDDLVAFAQQNPKNFKKIGLSKITLADEADAKKVLTMVKADPESFADTAKNQSEDVYADNGGAMGTKYGFELKSEFSDADLEAVFALSQGAVSDIIKTGSTYAIYRCTTAVSAPDYASADTLKAVKNYIFRYERGFAEDKVSAVAESFIKDAKVSDIYTAASTAGASIYDVAPFCVNYGAINYFSTPHVEKGDLDLSSAMYNSDFFIQAFSIKADEFSKPVILGNGVAVLKLKEEVRNDSIDEAVALYSNAIDSQNAESDIVTHFLSSDKLKDNFSKTFNKYFTFED